MQLEIQIRDYNDRLDAAVLLGTVRSQDNEECTLHAGANGLEALVSTLNLLGVKDWMTSEPLTYEAGNFYIASLATFFWNTSRSGATMILDGREMSIMEVVDFVYPDWENRQRSGKHIVKQGK
jgi:hypothetical protein